MKQNYDSKLDPYSADFDHDKYIRENFSQKKASPIKLTRLEIGTFIFFIISVPLIIIFQPLIDGVEEVQTPNSKSEWRQHECVNNCCELEYTGEEDIDLQHSD